MQSRVTPDNVIVALDVSSFKAAITLIDQMSAVKWWKVGLELFSAVGPSILTELKQRQKHIFLDLKLHDIPNTVARATEAAINHQVDMLTLHTMGGQPMLQAAAQAAQGTPCQLLAVTVLTSLSADQLSHDLHIEWPLADYVCHLTCLAQNSGINGIVCSPHEAKPCRQLGPDLILVTPGIRLSTHSHDQRRIMTPTSALAAGANYLVIGRSITESAHPAQTFMELCQIDE